MIIIAIETSCDETSVAIIKDKKVLTNIISSQIKLHQQFGGVVPELAAREHSDNIPFVLQEALDKAKVSIADIAFVAYTQTPGLISCLHVGRIIAETIASFLGRPLVPCNHLLGHIYASLIDGTWTFPVLGLLVSGGHTQLVLLKNHLDYQVLGSTLDDAVGECFDKVARMLGFNYPGGSEIAKQALTGKPTYTLPQPKNDKSLDFSFSGLKSASANIISKEGKNLNVQNFCASLENIIIKTLIDKLVMAIDREKPLTVVLAGGVSANEKLRKAFQDLNSRYANINFLVPNLEYCTDNAAMIGMLANYEITMKEDVE